ncbi:hypothetical protein EGW08_012882 [Elysia chlorotica]|uniref:BZIP domain-containing protein n=1 Tax=Elysia chlorotica TaxID=188477 RepID=A0A3S1A058_ELYCH|nr:hypothetical protein EGW08_012882 [Elysia chlorotica]
MSPMEPNSDRPSFVLQAHFSNSAISETAPVLTPDTISSPEPTGAEPIPVFTSALACPPIDVLTADTVSGQQFLAPDESLGFQETSHAGRVDAQMVFQYDTSFHNNNNIYTNTNCSAHFPENINASIPCSSVFTEGQHQRNANKTRCVRRQHVVTHCRHDPVRYRAGGSTSSICSRSSSSSPGTSRRYSNTSLGKLSTSTDEDVSMNPSTPNTPMTPLTPLTPGDTNGNALKDVTIFKFPATDSHTISCGTDNSISCSYGRLALDLDLEEDDDVFCNDISTIPTTIHTLSSKTTEETTVTDHCNARSHQNRNDNLYTFANNLAHSATASTTTTTTSINSHADIALLSSALLSHNQHSNHRHTAQCAKFKDAEDTGVPAPVGCSRASLSSSLSSGPDPLPALLDDVLQACDASSLGPSRDSNNNESAGLDPGLQPTAPSPSPSPALLSAALEAYQSGQITPLLKHELKWVIQLRRLSLGKDEMEVSFDPPTVAQMSDAEVTRAERRRKQNRIAARKFRQKRKSVEEQLVQTIQALKETNSSLEQKAEQLRGEKQALMEFMADHLLVCPFLSQLQLENLVIAEDAAQ